MKPETVTVTQIVKIADTDGVAIREGSVLRQIEDNDVGVVTRIIREGDRVRMLIPPCVGDLLISTRSNSVRVTNKCTKWRHVPRAEQTYDQRLLAWMYSKEPLTLISERASPDTAKAIDGIMALLPDEIVNWEEGPWPDSLEDALRFLVAHLTSLKSKS
jgi:hypothetical protein